MTSTVSSGARRPRKLRATDADRDAYAAIVSKAYSEGQLDSTNFDFRSTRVLNAKTIGELDDVVTDLLPPEESLPTPSVKPTRLNTINPRAAVGAGVAVLVTAVAGSIFISSVAGTSGIDLPIIDAPVPEDPVDLDMYTEEGLTQVVDAIVAQSGPDVTWLGLYGEYAIVTAPGAEGATRTAQYTWRDGEVTKQPGYDELEEDDLFDVQEDVDLAAVASLAAGASQRTGVTDPTSLYVSVNRAYGSTVDRPVEIRVNVSNDYQDGYITAEGDGTIIIEEGPAIEPNSTRFFEVDNIEAAIAAFEGRLGHDKITELNIYGEYVLCTAPPTPDADVVDGYEFRGGAIARKQSYTPYQPDNVQKAIFNITAIDAQIVANVMHQAPGHSELDGAEVSYAMVERPTEPKDHDPVIVVWVSSQYHGSERVIYSLAGELLQVG